VGCGQNGFKAAAGREKKGTTRSGIVMGACSHGYALLLTLGELISNRFAFKFVSLLQGEQYAAHEAVIRDIDRERMVCTKQLCLVLLML